MYLAIGTPNILRRRRRDDDTIPPPEPTRLRLYKYNPMTSKYDILLHRILDNNNNSSGANANATTSTAAADDPMTTTSTTDLFSLGNGVRFNDDASLLLVGFSSTGLRIYQTNIRNSSGCDDVEENNSTMMDNDNTVDDNNDIVVFDDDQPMYGIFPYDTAENTCEDTSITINWSRFLPKTTA